MKHTCHSIKTIQKGLEIKSNILLQQKLVAERYYLKCSCEKRSTVEVLKINKVWVKDCPAWGTDEKEGKYDQSLGKLRHWQACQYLYNDYSSCRETDKGAEIISEEIVTPNFPNLFKKFIYISKKFNQQVVWSQNDIYHK